MAAAYTIDVRPPARRSLRQLDPPVRKAVAQVIDGLAADPRPPGFLPLTGHRPYLRVRSGDYRVIYAVDDHARVVIIAAVGHRREICRSFDVQQVNAAPFVSADIGAARQPGGRERREDRIRPRGSGLRSSSSGSRSSAFEVLLTTSSATSMTRLPRVRAALLSRSNASRVRSRCRSASTPMACSTRTRAVSACSSWATVTASRAASSAAGAPVRGRACRGAGAAGGGGHEVRGQQVREHHRARQVGDFLVADDPAPRGSADYRLTRYRRAAHLPLPSLAPLVIPARAPRCLANCGEFICATPFGISKYIGTGEN